MPNLPSQATLIVGKALRAGFDCSEQPLPEDLEILRCCLDGTDRRRRIQARVTVPGQTLKLHRPADVHWLPADQVPETGSEWRGNQRHFESLRKAVEFVTQELTIADRANVWITNEDGDLSIEQIEKMTAS